MGSLWTNHLRPPAFPALRGDADTDVLVLGGGMTGVLCALRLREAGVDCLLLEGRRIGGGATGGTTAVLTVQREALYRDVIREHGLEKAKLLLDANRKAIGQFRKLAERIDCDFEERPAVLFTRDDRNLLECEAAALRTLGFDAELTDETSLPFPVAGALRYPGMAQLHPLKFLYAAARGLPICENTVARKLEGTTAVTDHGRVHARKVIVATRIPTVCGQGLYELKLRPKRVSVLALEHAKDLGCSLRDVAEDGVCLRRHGQSLLLGGANGLDALRAFAGEHFPEAREFCAWAARDCVSLDGLPYVGPCAPKRQDVYVAAGFGFRGMSAAMTTASVLTDMALGRENPCAPVFDPARAPASGRLVTNALTVFFKGPPRA